jgi:drug/metabolite transporter (DMT)-like permease
VEFLMPVMGNEARGMLLGALGVLLFSLTLPMTRIAVTHLDPMFVGLGRSVIAACLAALWLAWRRPPLPTRAQWKRLALTALGVILGFPALTSWAMRVVPSSHGAIVVGLLPLATAIAGAWLLRERPSAAFWVAAAAGSALVVGYALLHGGGALSLADLALFGAIMAGAFGYAQGAVLTREIGGEATISWALVLSLPFLLPPVIAGSLRSDLAAATLPQWLALGYLALMSQYVGFFAWYRGLALGGVARVSQVQLAQVFLTMGFAALLLGERITPAMLVFAVAVVATVAIGRRMPVRRV